MKALRPQFCSVLFSTSNGLVPSWEQGNPQRGPCQVWDRRWRSQRVKKCMWWQGAGIMVEEARVCVYKPRSHSTPKKARLGALLQSATFTHSAKERGSPRSRSWRLLSHGGENYVLKKSTCACLLVLLLSLPCPNLRTKIHDKSHFIFTDKSLLPLRSIPKNYLEPQMWTWM